MLNEVWQNKLSLCRTINMSRACVQNSCMCGAEGSQGRIKKGHWLPVFFKTMLSKHHRCCCKSPTGPMCTCSSLWCKWTNSIHRYVTTCSAWISHSSAWLTELTGLPEHRSLSSITYRACLSQASITEWMESKSHNVKPWTYKMGKGRKLPQVQDSQTWWFTVTSKWNKPKDACEKWYEHENAQLNTFFQTHMLQRGQMGHWPVPASVNVTVKKRHCVEDEIQHTHATTDSIHISC